MAEAAAPSAADNAAMPALRPPSVLPRAPWRGGPAAARAWPWPVVVVALLLLLLTAGPVRAVTTALRQLGTAEFALQADGPWQPVALPDSWVTRGVPRPGLGWYRLRTELPAAATDTAGGVWALRLERVSSHHRLWLNGALLHDTLTAAASDPGSGRAQPVPLLLHLPPALLRPGVNELVFQVD